MFFVVVFFWMSFHQNGLTLTWFARDYTVKQVGPFDLPLLHPAFIACCGIFSAGPRAAGQKEQALPERG
ncbi:MAG: hypothetical protein MZV63_08870 [Marinilabiliales bacterium]|nr:hypothetical protein [Marinilabiliales bacterium]